MLTLNIYPAWRVRHDDLISTQDVVTSLDEYVNRDDGMFSFYEYARYFMPDYTVHILNMTSQQRMDGVMVSMTSLIKSGWTEYDTDLRMIQ